MNKFIPVGDTFEVEGKTYKAVNASGCAGCCVLDLNDCSMFPVCSAEERDDDTSVIFVYADKKTPEDLVSTEDLEALGLTYKDLVSLYAVLGNYSLQPGNVFAAIQRLLDPELRGVDIFNSRLHTSQIESKLESLIFGEGLQAKKLAELKERQRKIQEEIDKLM